MQIQKTAEPAGYGQFAPTGLMRGLIACTRGCDASWAGKRMAFLLRGLAVRLLAGKPVDIESIGARMRMSPYNNVCEKRILFTPQYFDPIERALLQSRITPDFVFLDIGANIGGYSLFVAAHAGPGARIVSIEPQPEIFERLVYNIGLNDFCAVKALNCAVADLNGEITLFVAAGNKGETSMRIVNADSAGEQISVPSKTLLSIVNEEQFERIDAVKLDVEGAEDLILEPFFREAPAHLRPKLVLMEFSHDRWAADLGHILAECGYREVMRTRTNVAYELN
jgi:FkbM family methyltransferase